MSFIVFFFFVKSFFLTLFWKSTEKLNIVFKIYLNPRNPYVDKRLG